MNSILKGLSWTAMSTIIITFFFLLQYIFLSNQISINEMGIVGIAMMVIGLSQVFSDAGISNAIIYFKKNDFSHYKALTIINFLIGAIAFSIFLLLNDFLFDLFKYSNTSEYTLLISLNMLIIPIGQVSYSHLQKNMKFDVIAKIEIFSVTFSTIVFFALLFFNNPLTIFLLSQNIYYLSKALLYVNQSKIKYIKTPVKFKGLSKYFVYGLQQMFDRILGYIYLRSEIFLIGVLLGPTYLGMYTFINNIVIQPVSRVIPIFNKVFLPHLSNLQSSVKDLRTSKLSMMKLLSFSALIIYILIYSNLDIIINIIDAKYLDAFLIGVFMIILYILRSFNSSGGILAYATGNITRSIKYNILKVSMLIPLYLFVNPNINIYNLILMFIIIQIFMNFLNIKMIISPILNMQSLAILNYLRLPYIFLFLFVLLIIFTEIIDIYTYVSSILNILCIILFLLFIMRRKKNENIISN